MGVSGTLSLIATVMTGSRCMTATVSLRTLKDLVVAVRMDLMGMVLLAIATATPEGQTPPKCPHAPYPPHAGDPRAQNVTLARPWDVMWLWAKHATSPRWVVASRTSPAYPDPTLKG